LAPVAWLALALAAAVALKLSLLPLVNSDLTHYVVPWLQHIRNHGRAALGDVFTDYAPGYTYFLWAGLALAPALPDVALIKTISILADTAMAALAGLLAWRVGADPQRGVWAAAAVLMLPAVVLNSGAWGQSDAIWCAFLLAALLCLLGDRLAAACLLWGCALALKPQAVFLAPVLGGVLLARRRLWLLPLVALPYVLASLPMILEGRRWTSIFAVYASAAIFSRQLSSSAPNLWSWLPPDAGVPAMLAGIAAGAVAGLLILLSVLRLDRRDPLGVLVAAAFACTVLPFLLPKMHDRYFYAGEVLAVVLALLRPALVPAVVAGQTAALLAYQPMLLGLYGWRAPVGGLFNLVAVILLGLAWLAAWRGVAEHPSGRVPRADGGTSDLPARRCSGTPRPGAVCAPPQ
jgi:Gpi18-like mannosyltransferase